MAESYDNPNKGKPEKPAAPKKVVPAGKPTPPPAPDGPDG